MKQVGRLPKCDNRFSFSACVFWFDSDSTSQLRRSLATRSLECLRCERMFTNATRLRTGKLRSEQSKRKKRFASYVYERRPTIPQRSSRMLQCRHQSESWQRALRSRSRDCPRDVQPKDVRQERTAGRGARQEHFLSSTV